jgi:hypothetical protein
MEPVALRRGPGRAVHPPDKCTAPVTERSRNKSLLAELAYSAAIDPPAPKTIARDRDGHPVYRFWHGHISSLIAAQRPDADADMIAHVMLGALHSEPILAQLTTEGPKRLATTMRALACAVLDAPAGDAPAGDAPAGDAPAGDAPAGDAPAGDAPAG